MTEISNEARLKGKTVLVTGGGGMIGSRIASALVREGAAVTILDSFTAYPFDTTEIFGLSRLDVDVVRGSITDRHLVDTLVKRNDYVIHAAAHADVAACISDYQIDFDTNVKGTFNLLDAALRWSTRRFVFVSSASVYGNRTPISRVVDEAERVEPVSTYANSKLWGENQARLFSELYGLPTTCIRYFSVYGPPQIPKQRSQSWCVAKFSAQALRGKPITIYGDGRQVRDFIFVDDVADGTLLGMLRPEAENQVFNLGTGKAIEILTVAMRIKELVADVPIHFQPRPTGDPSGVAADTTRMKKILGWFPRITFDAGLSTYLAWIKENTNLIPEFVE